MYIAEFFSVSSYSAQLGESALTSEPTEGIDRDPSVVSADSKSILKLDAKITHEAAKGNGANLETTFQIKYELMANAISDRQLYLVSRLYQLKPNSN